MNLGPLGYEARVKLCHSDAEQYHPTAADESLCGCWVAVNKSSTSAAAAADTVAGSPTPFSARPAIAEPWAVAPDANN